MGNVINLDDKIPDGLSIRTVGETIIIKNKNGSIELDKSMAAFVAKELPVFLSPMHMSLVFMHIAALVACNGSQGVKTEHIEIFHDNFENLFLKDFMPSAEG